MATRWDYLPGLNDDYVARNVEDYKKAIKAKNVGSSALRGGAREAVIEAGGRGAARLAGRAYAPVAAFKPAMTLAVKLMSALALASAWLMNLDWVM